MVVFRRRLITFWNEVRYEKRFEGEISSLLISIEEDAAKVGKPVLICKFVFD